MINYVYIAGAGLGGLILGMLLGKVIFSRKKELEDMQRHVKQERVKSDARVSKAMEELSQAVNDQKLLSYFISTFPQLIQNIYEATDITRLADIITLFFEKMLNAKQVAFFVYKPQETKLVMVSKKGLPDQVPLGYTIRLGEGKIGWAAQKRMVMSDEDFETETYMVRQQIDKNTTIYFKVDLCAPVTYVDSLLGIVSIGNMIRRSKVEKILLQTACDIVSPYMKHLIDVPKPSEQEEQAQQGKKLKVMVDKSVFINNLDQRVEEAKMMHGSLLAVAFIEIDNYHFFVQNYGITAGENTLSLISNMILHELPAASEKANFQENLYCVYFLNKKVNEIYSSLQKLVDAINTYEFPVDTPRETGHLTVSVGLSFYPYNADSPETLLAHATKNVRLAHSSGGNQIQPPMDNAIDEGTPDSEFDIDIINAFEE